MRVEFSTLQRSHSLRVGPLERTGRLCSNVIVRGFAHQTLVRPSGGMWYRRWSLHGSVTPSQAGRRFRVSPQYSTGAAMLATLGMLILIHLVAQPAKPSANISF